MLEVNLRQLADNELVPVNIAALALSVAGEFRFPAEEAAAATAQGDANVHTGPAVIVHCADRRDVLECLEFASRHGLLVAMHNSHKDPANWSDCDHGIAVDLSALSAKARKTCAQRSARPISAGSATMHSTGL
ncbi:hypothetical protein [Aquisalimonas sp.]|uniref:hypothetical protein n=1 Tax=Aquisalimonas sp. TaxID=1872621 RepID=UPI0025C3C21D|nr:hypothetical protein [Aquisalimonas sp.]